MTRHATRQFRGDWLKAARERTEPRVTNEKLARQCDVTLRTVQRWQDGETEPRGAQLLALCRALGVTPDALYEPLEQPERAA